MNKFFTLLAAAMMIALISCERHSGIDTSATDENTSIVEEQSPIKGVWKCHLNGGQMTLEYGERSVKYTSYAEFYNATAVYDGTYTIKGNEITHEFTSLTTKNSSKISYYSPDQLPKDALLQDTNTIIYMDYSYKRQ